MIPILNIGDKRHVQFHKDNLRHLSRFPDFSITKTSMTDLQKHNDYKIKMIPWEIELTMIKNMNPNMEEMTCRTRMKDDR